MNPESRKELKALLHLLARRRLGKSFEMGPVLLVPPTPAAVAGDYGLGIVRYGSRELYRFGLREDEWIQHVAIFGRTGSGKTNVGFLVLRGFLEKGKPFRV